MSAGSSAKGSLRGPLGAFAGLTLAELSGFPVGQIASALAFVAVAIGALCLTLGLKDAARVFLGPALLLVAIAIAAPMVRGILAGVTADLQRWRRRPPLCW